MHYPIEDSLSQCACDCGTGQVQSTVACPVCSRLGSTIKPVTPQNTIKRSVLTKLDTEQDYHFCENPECDGYEILPEDVYDAIVTEEERIDG